MSEKLQEFVRQSIKELLESLPPEERLKGLPAEERVKGLPVEERLKGLSPEEVLRALPPGTLEAILKRLQNDSGAAEE